MNEVHKQEAQELPRESQAEVTFKSTYGKLDERTALVKVSGTQKRLIAGFTACVLVGLWVIAK